MDFSFDVTILGLLVLVVGAALIGAGMGLFDENGTPYWWLMTGIGALIGAFVLSEYVGLDTFAPVWEGVALLPALVGGLVVGAAVELTMHFTHRGTPFHRGHPA